MALCGKYDRDFAARLSNTVHSQHHQHNPTNMESGHLLTHSGLTHLEVSLMFSPGFFRQLVYSFFVFSVI